ncbi:MAG: hypothetical protein EDM75_16465 [Chlorobiota bacterium]|nr:MAG: hypothetical protein EDM75_16465 [Chlorobiota bacterium]
MKSKFYNLLAIVFVLFAVQSSFAQYTDPSTREAYLTAGPITVDGNMNEAAWNGVQEYLVFGPNAPSTLHMQGVTGGVHVTNQVPYKDTTLD